MPLPCIQTKHTANIVAKTHNIAITEYVDVDSHVFFKIAYT